MLIREFMKILLNKNSIFAMNETYLPLLKFHPICQLPLHANYGITNKSIVCIAGRDFPECFFSFLSLSKYFRNTACGKI